MAKNRGPTERLASPRVMPQIEPSRMSTPVEITSGSFAGGASGPSSISPPVPHQHQAAAAATATYAFGASAGAGMSFSSGSTSGRFPRAVPKAKPPAPTFTLTPTASPASNASATAVSSSANGQLVRRLLRFVWQQVRKHTLIAFAIALLAVLVVCIWSAPASPAIGGYNTSTCTLQCTTFLINYV